jgi:hypothetical protein
LFAFSGVAGNVRGAEPLGGLAFGPDGLLHGATASGGGGGGGSTYRIRQLGPHAGTDAPGFAPGVAVLRARVQTGGETVNATFEYGATESLGESVPATAGAGEVSPAYFSAPLSGLAPGATIFFRVRANNASGSSVGLTRSFTMPNPYDAWKLQYFGTTAVSPTEDSDLDGTPNLAEYALNSAPNAPDAANSLRSVLTNYPEGLRLSSTILRDPQRTDATVVVEAADTPAGPWTPLAVSTGGGPFSGPGYYGGDSSTPGVKSVEIRDLVNVSEGAQRFFRVRVSIP